MGEVLHKTDLSRWRLKSREGAHRWLYLKEDEAVLEPQSAAERYFLGLSTDLPELEKAGDFPSAAQNGWSFYQSLQMDEGHWACDYGGPSFLLPGLVFALYIVDAEIPVEWRTEMTRYLQHHQNEDGGWGLYLGGESTVFATALYYVMLRILGHEPTTPLLAKARACLLRLGGAIGVPQWGKLWLACLNLYGWDGISCIPPELWLLPDWVPFHPWRWWVQCRVVYLPTSYLYANRCTKPLNDLLRTIRSEIYIEPYSSIDFSKHRTTVAATDLKKRPSVIATVANMVLAAWETYLRPSWLLERANERVLHLIDREDANTSYNCLAPVNKAFHVVAVFYSAGKDSEKLRRHLEQLPTYMWQSGDGMTSGGTNGVQVWDTAFSIQAAFEAGLTNHPEFRGSLEKALDFLDMSQLRDDLSDPYRQKRKGGWPFSTKDNGYIVSDCSAESLKAVIFLQEECGFPKRVSDDRLKQCIDTLLSMQNSDGGFASYEKTRAGAWLELLNPAEVFDRIMVEYSYPECTTAVLTALDLFRKHFPSYRANDLSKTISRAVRYVQNAQRPDGSWYGAWGVCFTYASFFALQSLEAVGEVWETSERVKRSCAFLLSKQKEDGGWGEDPMSCELFEYVQHRESQVVNTAWAVLALMHARYPDSAPIEKGLELIRSRQLADGSWAQESVEGVFNCTCMIGYPNYKLYFTVWALGKYDHIYKPLMTGRKEY